jgi:hypothetical protein
MECYHLPVYQENILESHHVKSSRIHPANFLNVLFFWYIPHLNIHNISERCRQTLDTSSTWTYGQKHLICVIAERILSWPIQLFSLNVWAGIVGKLHVLPHRLACNYYWDFSCMICQSYWQSKMWYMLDSLLAHLNSAGWDVLSNTYHDQWIGRGGPTAWRSCLQDLNGFLPVGHPKSLVCGGPVDNEEASPSCGCLSRLCAATTALLNVYSGPWWDVSWPSLTLMENILSACCKYTLSAVTHKWNVSGHMLIWTFFLGLVCGTRIQSLSAPFSYTLYIFNK